MSSEPLMPPISCPPDWPLVRLHEVALKIGSGATPTGGQAVYQPVRTGFALIRSQNIFDRAFSDAGLAFISDAQARGLRGVELKPRDLLLNITGDGVTFGRACMVPEGVLPACVNQHVSIIRLDSKRADPGFVLSYLTHPAVKGYIEAFNAGGSRRAITKAHIESFVVPLPPLTVQKAISQVLGTLDDRIALLRETNATLEAIAQALFRSWFVDFDPVRAKQQGLAPAGMDEATAALFPATDEDWQGQASRPAVSELIASGALLIGDGYRAKNDELGQPGMPFVRAGDLDAGQIAPTKDYLAEPAVKAASTKTAKPGDTAFTSKGTIGRFAFVDNASGEAVYSPQVCFWRSLRADIIEPAYLHYWMKSAAFKVQVDVVRGQAAIMDYVSLADQRRMRLDLPPIGVQKRFAEVARVLLERISCNRVTATYLASVRDTLLPRLISGQLRLPQAEILVAEADEALS